ncbi:aminoacyl-histidine dipeptidase, putative [Entamoeba invadens IP1]|uniref:Aminoacyl-histidine dipeptidase, putative n=1 Tax=Entamoeba invadens IP1 TaxID=370355 RepID=A0A0A1UED7_ENTIV|nr:aminoacyl-histidine dipeptidase, putative [Entamoeba invadens IP1]ELP92151.1 aminoacyl-histidine dipeptidase, putative [Entamoeba invadens IP1]|eukprot:XP_004258922.1 aminoacyl-histidine dipeptidase, putative [Entamoeba invadens IP1]
MTGYFTIAHNDEVYTSILTKCSTIPERVYWKWFLRLSEIPRPSYHCLPFSDWVLSQAKSLHLEACRDKSNNVCVHIPSSKGYEAAPAVILQAHMDMVASVIEGKDFDFTTTPITVLFKDKVLCADGTTLGADDGAGMASLFSVMELHDTFLHPKVECLFTTDEEPGLLGAIELKEGELFESAKYLINVDSEDWGELCVSSAGCAQRNMTHQITRTCATGDLVEIKVDNFVGGHSGGEIHKQRASALKWLVALVLQTNAIQQDIKLVQFSAGHTDNAIPMKGVMSLILPNGEEYMKKAKEYHTALCTLYKGAENEEGPKLDIKVTQNVTMNALTLTDSVNFLYLLKDIPHGVIKFSDDVPDLVETSNSLSIGKIDDDKTFICTLSRSADNNHLAEVVQSIEILAKFHKYVIEVPTPDIGGWPAAVASKLVEETKKTYKELYGQDMKVMAIHAGLENSIVLNQYPNMKLESISIGPTCKDVHTPQETIEIESGNKLLDLVFALLSKLN